MALSESNGEIVPFLCTGDLNDYSTTSTTSSTSTSTSTDQPREYVPFKACGEIKHDSDRTYDKPSQHQDVIQPPIAPAYKKVLEMMKSNLL
jgi:hypothetical protein